MLALTSVISDDIGIRIGNFAFSFNANLIIYLVIAALIGLLAEGLVGRRLPFGFIGAIIAALVGTWLMTQIIIITGIGDIIFYGVPLVRALIGALIFVVIWNILVSAFYRRRDYV